jgi:type I restriction enzyme S subunit
VAEFAFLLLKSEYLQAPLSRATRSAQAGFNKNDLAAINFPLPPLAEQHRIVAKVDELMGLCDQLEAARAEREAARDRLAAASLARLNAPDPDPTLFADDARFALAALPALTTRHDQIKQLRQTILNLAVGGKLVAQDPRDEPAAVALKRRRIVVSAETPSELPSSWVWVNVGAVAEARLGKMLDSAKNKGEPRRYLRNINVRWFDFDLSNLLKMRLEDKELEEFSLRSEDVLICEGGEPGRAAVWDEREENIYFQKAIHRVRFLNFVNSNYFVKVLRSSADDGRLAKYFTGTGIKHFTGRSLDAYPFPLPPLAEQNRIVAKVDAMMALCDQLEASLTETDATRRRLFEALLSEVLMPAEAREMEAAE